MDDRQFKENIDRIRRNEKDGLKNIYEEYNPMIYSTVFEILRSREDAEDITSEFFIRLWDIAPGYREGRGHRAWMLTIARNMAIDHIRKRKREELMEEIPDHGHPGEAFPEEAICSRTTLEQAMDQLKAEEREVVNLKIMGQLTFKEIAALLKKPQGTVSWCYQTAIRKLKEVQL
ncbi:MAG TPA: sigma-70 family RNA polymerase sigma factor [Candidatus Lachnoclostridium stercoravium]|uniref:Sigma-70 family RNA polymerase sigma factor n=1 Tax=Candidatus Lachnoclostridium stercoravium TaxID=2838633 RepID=A0A9D2KN04_9FIRM|nr:sigma-70 family RNA polymerase sigma factor [Candidatus Lachnoclostridium stercoravium]